MRTLVAVALGTAFSVPATAQTMAPPCEPYDEVSERLAREYDERPMGRGLDSRGFLLELWASEKTGTWTALLIRPDGIACMARIGEAWGPIAEAEPPGEPM